MKYRQVHVNCRLVSPDSPQVVSESQVWRQQTEAMGNEMAQLKIKVGRATAPLVCSLNLMQVNQLQQSLNESQQSAAAMAENMQQLEAERNKMYDELQASARASNDREKSLNQSKAELQAASTELAQLRGRLSQVEVLEMELESSKLRQQDLETKLKRQTLQAEGSPDRIRLGASAEEKIVGESENKKLELAVKFSTSFVCDGNLMAFFWITGRSTERTEPKIDG
mmetsp:Transcript_39840/g.125153  ORF Transcript_39840/g.125153 Transcript_39840/m.125153 type:complete len:225 (-) Transcript_39840:588-1262(-)